MSSWPLASGTVACIGLALFGRFASADEKTPLRICEALERTSTSTPSRAVNNKSGPAPFALSAKVNLLSPSHVLPRSIKPGDTAHTGDAFTLTAWADQPIFLYVVDYKADRWSSLLFPQAQDTTVPGNEPLRLPTRNPTYRLTGRPGEIGLLVYASRRPLDAAGCAMLRLQCPLWSGSGRTRGEAQEPKDPPPPPPPPGPARNQRDVTLVGQDYVATTRSEADGTALLPFCFRQEP